VYENDRCQIEAETLMKARKAGIAVPDVIGVGDRALLLELIPGKSVNDYLGMPGMGEKVLGVAGWLAAFPQGVPARGRGSCKVRRHFQELHRLRPHLRHRLRDVPHGPT